nr:ADP-ribosylglycohydrolase family protein [bacterium]
MIDYLGLKYTDGLEHEAEQARDEGRVGAQALEGQIASILAMPEGEARQAAAAAILDAVQAMPYEPGRGTEEPSCLEGIRALAPHAGSMPAPQGEALFNRVYGAWLGRCSGCLLGKPVEGWMRARIMGLLSDTGNNPPSFYMSRDIAPELIEKYDMGEGRAWIDRVSYMPEDDDTNYTLIGLKVLERNGRDFTPDDVVKTWLEDLPVLHMYTAERVAYRNFLHLVEPPASGAWRNPYREWIGAQIRADFFGYINPGNPQAAAEMAWRDACISHVKNGIYGEMMMAAMIASAFVRGSIREVIEDGLAEIPPQSRLVKAMREVMAWYDGGMAAEQALERIHTLWQEGNGHHWCHTISNAQICAIALLWGQADFERTIGLAVMGALDTDCNAATVGSILGAFKGADQLPQKWIAPLNDTLLSGVDGFGLVKISDMARRTMPFIR